MNRRGLFSFLAASPVGLATVATSKLEEPGSPRENHVRLPNLEPGALITIVNNSDKVIFIHPAK